MSGIKAIGGSQVGWCRGINSSYPADAEAVVLIRGLVGEMAARAEADVERLAAIRLAVSEAASNAVLHAYNETPGEIHLTAQVVDGELTVLIADDGCGLTGRSPNPGLGWGWKLIADACDDLTIAERGGGGIEMRMHFRLQPSVAGRDDHALPEQFATA
jgi:anti-sigma regulatory factor (Ser/Thr protein kinase)